MWANTRLGFNSIGWFFRSFEFFTSLTHAWFQGRCLQFQSVYLIDNFPDFFFTSRSPPPPYLFRAVNFSGDFFKCCLTSMLSGVVTFPLLRPCGVVCATQGQSHGAGEARTASCRAGGRPQGDKHAAQAHAIGEFSLATYARSTGGGGVHARVCAFCACVPP